MSYLRYLCLFTYCGVFFVLFVFVLFLVYLLLPVSLDFPFVDCPSVFSNIYLVELCVDCEYHAIVATRTIDLTDKISYDYCTNNLA